MLVSLKYLLLIDVLGHFCLTIAMITFLDLTMPLEFDRKLVACTAELCVKGF